MAHVYCPECGYNNPESAHFCAKCGAALVVPEEGESTEAFAAPEVDESLDPIEDLGQRVDVDRLEDALPLGLLQPCDELGPQDVDLSVQEPPAVRDLVLLVG
jgi:ribosomal protein S27E